MYIKILKKLIDNEFGELNKASQYIRGVKSEHFTRIADELYTEFQKEMQELREENEALKAELRKYNDL